MLFSKPRTERIEIEGGMGSPKEEEILANKPVLFGEMKDGKFSLWACAEKPSPSVCERCYERDCSFRER